MKLCKDCKRFVPYPDQLDENDGGCLEYSDTYEFYSVDAKMERQTNWLGFCGPEAKHWEAKE